MLTSLHLENLGVIDSADLELGAGLTALTGETGAGKTMILTSLRLIQGGRADANAVRLGQDKAHVDAIFELTDEQTAQLGAQGLEVEEGELYVSRSLPTNGRSRAFVNGRPVPSKTLSETTEPLIVIHGQTDQLKLKDSGAARDLLDRYATYIDPQHAQLLAAYQQAWREAVNWKRTLDALEADWDAHVAKTKYLQEIVEAIAKLGVSPGEETRLDEQIDALANVESLRETLTDALASLGGEAQTGGELPGIVELSGRIAAELRKASRMSGKLAGVLALAESLETQAHELQGELASLLGELTDDPAELERLSQRKAQLLELMRGRATTAAELLEWNERAQRELIELEQVGDPQAAREQLAKAQAEVMAAGEKLSTSRTRAAAELGKKVSLELKSLAMGSASFQVQLEPGKPTATGVEKVGLFLQPHASAPLRKLGEGASGGELSRVMLALEVVLGEQEVAQTYVFDEVDAGIGGATAIEVAARLAKLAETQQVLVVTHLPQVAAVAARQYVVSKQDGLASVSLVEGEARVDEIARMLAGEVSTAARRHARELLGRSS